MLASLSFAIVLARAWALRQNAEWPRRLALDHLADAILRAQGAYNGPLGGQLERCRRASASCATGPPYSQQSLLKALLLPFLTFGGSSLVDYLALASP